MKKNYFLFLLAVLPAFILQAQSFTAAKDTVKFEGKSTAGEINGRIYLQNTSSSTLKLRVTRVIESMPTAWETSFCNQTHCYPNIVDSADFEVSPNGQNYLLVHFYPNNADGDGVVKLKVSDVDNPQVSYELTFIGKTATPLMVEENSFIELSIYPNPVRDILTIELNNQKDVPYIIYNSIGMAVHSGYMASASNNIKIDVSSFDKGFYFLQFGENKEQITRKIIKN
ncbi:MAG: T9SS type A sorting domain-containing protein [Bacteroidetes bacterium]|nr:T9SS type A sorting domain-containing protein [Bacteroidota bacterium]